MKEISEKIYREEIQPMLAGMIAGTIMSGATEYRGIPEGVEKEIKRSIAKIARAYHKSKITPS